MLRGSLAIALLLGSACSGGHPPLAPSPTRSDAGPRPEDPCREVGRVADALAPDVMIALDRSGSMSERGRWTSAVAAIDTVTEAFDDRIRFGLTTFPSRGLGECSAGEVLVPTDVRNSGSIARALRMVGPMGGTPTAATLTELAATLAAPDRTAYVLLITDGAPNCNAALDPMTCELTTRDLPPSSQLCLDDLDTVAAAGELARLGVRVFVVGLDSDFPEVFDALAAAGGTERHVSASPESLRAVALGIAATLAACEYELIEGFDDPAKIRVTIDGEELEMDPVDGWRLLDDRVEIVGAACEGIRDGQPHDVVVMRDCSVI